MNPIDAEQSYKGDYFIVQALLAVNPNHPNWSDVRKSSINGWKELDNNPILRMPRYAFDRFWTDFLAWVDREAAIEGFSYLMALPQKHQLRLVRVKVKKTVRVVGQRQIERGSK